MANLSEDLYNKLTTIFERAVNNPLNIQQLDRLRAECRQLANTLQAGVTEIAERKALEVCKLLNDATKLGFQKVAAEIEMLKQEKVCESQSQATSTDASQSDTSVSQDSV